MKKAVCIVLIPFILIQVTVEAGYCPKNCICRDDTIPPPLQLTVAPTLDITDVQCNITQEGFTINEEAEKIMASKPTNQTVGFLFKCKQNISIIWTNASFLERTVSFVVANCKLINNGYQLVFPVNSELRALWFSNSGGEAFLHNIKYRGLSELRSLAIRSNALTTFPESLKIATRTSFRLFSLDLVLNNLTTIDCELFENVPFLLNLRLDYNRISKVPSCICNKVKLAFLTLDGNELTEINELTTPQCVNVDIPKQMSFALNRISKLNPFPKGANIMSVNLSFNNISTIKTDTFADTQFLQQVLLNNNRIKEIEKYAFRGVDRLVLLYLNNNMLETFSLLSAPSPGLRPAMLNVYINLNENQLKYPPFHENGYYYPTNFEVQAGNNPFQCDCKIKTFQTAINNKIILQPNTQMSGYKDFTCAIPTKYRKYSIMSLNFNKTCPILEYCPAQCKCKRNNVEATVVVDCNYCNLTHLPTTMPPGKLEINLYGNKIKTFEEKPYFNRIVSMDVSANKISLVTELALSSLTNAAEIKLKQNLIKMLPRTVETWNPVNVTVLSLQDNQWLCNCDTLWLKNWLIKQKDILEDYDDKICYENGKQSQKYLDFIIDCNDYRPTAISLSVSATVIITIAILVHIYRAEIKLFMFVRFRWHPFDKFKLEDKAYDAFISYAEEDSHWVHHHLIKSLEEDHIPPFSTCFHHRDFLPGAPIADNIQSAIESSHCTIIILSKAFLQSEWCTFEFNVAHRCMLQKVIGKVIIILKEKVSNRDLTPDIRSYLRTMTYLEVNDHWFTNKLYYALPQKNN